LFVANRCAFGDFDSKGSETPDASRVDPLAGLPFRERPSLDDPGVTEMILEATDDALAVRWP
jgi:hypothetical protein